MIIRFNILSASFALALCLTAAAFGQSSGFALDPTVITVSAATFQPESPLASGSIVAAFGKDLSNSAAFNSVTIRLKGSDGIERFVSKFFYVSSDQVNYQIPDGMPDSDYTIPH
ncbi:MAG: hypothetical protein M3X11_15270 [Acidobacteriota bacterium]|nr:hypothetical protein [Acidobacteriota bacterium]